MPKGPAARVLDPVMHPLPGMLAPGPGSMTVLIGGKPAWRGVPAAAAAALGAAKATSDATIKTAEAATLAAAGTPGAPAAKAAEESVKAAAASAMGALITGMAGGADIHTCATPLPLPPHGPGVVIDGSPTVLINGLPACRQGDTVLEALGPPDKIAPVCCLTVIIGDAPGVSGPSVTTGLGADIDALVDKSDTLKSNLQALLEQGWTISYGTPGGGTFANRNTKSIVVDPNEAGNPAAVVQGLAHESGHALYKMDPYVPPDGLTKDEYVQRNLDRHLKDEGEATLMNAQVRNEINGNGGPDIGIAGAQPAKYADMAAEDADYADRDDVRRRIGSEYADNEHTSTPPNPSYRDYYSKTYSDHYDAHPPAP
jgi:uncharacterized Zn-binding protein involved in type VI secretion